MLVACNESAGAMACSNNSGGVECGSPSPTQLLLKRCDTGALTALTVPSTYTPGTVVQLQFQGSNGGCYTVTNNTASGTISGFNFNTISGCTVSSCSATCSVGGCPLTANSFASASFNVSVPSSDVTFGGNGACTAPYLAMLSNGEGGCTLEGPATVVCYSYSGDYLGTFTGSVVLNILAAPAGACGTAGTRLWQAQYTGPTGFGPHGNGYAQGTDTAALSISTSGATVNFNGADTGGSFQGLTGVGNFEATITP